MSDENQRRMDQLESFVVDELVKLEKKLKGMVDSNTSNQDRIIELEKKVKEMKSWEDYLAHGGLLEQIMDKVEALEKKYEAVLNTAIEHDHMEFEAIEAMIGNPILGDGIPEDARFGPGLKQEIAELKAILQKFLNVMQIDEPVGDVQQEIRELMKKLEGGTSQKDSPEGSFEQLRVNQKKYTESNSVKSINHISEINGEKMRKYRCLDCNRVFSLSELDKNKEAELMCPICNCTGFDYADSKPSFINTPSSARRSLHEYLKFYQVVTKEDLTLMIGRGSSGNYGAWNEFWNDMKEKYLSESSVEEKDAQ